MTYRLGIDLGTTYTAAAVHRDGVTRLVPLGLRQPEIPSVVAVTDDGVLVGDAAEHHARHAPSTLIRNFKRRFGDPTPIVVGGKPWSPERLSAEILRMVVERTGEMEGGPPSSIVLTHPASWGDYKLDALRQAAQLASLDCHLLAEPLAAASHYASLNRLSDRARLVVFDFGGGTFDTSIVVVDGAGFESIGEPIGLERLGGVDLDEAILSFVCDQIDVDPFTVGETPEGLKALARLRAECRDAKELLSSAESSTIAINIAGDEHEIVLTRPTFEQMIEHSLEAAMATVEQSLARAGLTLDDVDAILLAGGSSRIPAVQRMLVDRLARPVLADGDPKNAVARGAATISLETVVEPPLEADTPVAPAPPFVSPPTRVEAPRLPEGNVPPSPPVNGAIEATPATLHEVPDLNPTEVQEPPSSTSPRRTLTIAAVAVVAAISLVAIAVGASLLRSDDPQLNTEASSTDATLSAAVAPTDGSEGNEPDRAETTQPDEASTTEATEPTDAFAGTVVTITGPDTSDAAAGAIQDALDVFATDNGMTITYTGSADFTSDIRAQAAAGSPPDIALYPNLGIFGELVETGTVMPVSASVVDATDWPSAFLDVGAIGGVQYAMPIQVEPKSVVWYQPEAFARRGYSVPTTLQEFLDLTDTMIADGETPLCVGIESGQATGWTYTDWVEDMMLRSAGPEAYRQWIAGDLTFDDPVVIEQMAAVIDLWNTPGMVFASGGSIASTSFADNAQPLLDGDCLMHRQASFFASFFPASTPLGGGGEDAVDAFYFPADTGRPVLIAGTVAGVHADRPEVWAVLDYMASTEYADARQAAQAERTGGISGFLSAAEGIDTDLYQPIERSFLEILANGDGLHPDASDLMPLEVGTGTFWTEGTALVGGNRTVPEAAANIAASWPR